MDSFHLRQEYTLVSYKYVTHRYNSKTVSVKCTM